MLCFRLFAIRIAKLAYKMSWVSSFLPCFRKIGSYRPRRPADLIRQGIFFIDGEAMAFSKDTLLKRECLFVDA